MYPLSIICPLLRARLRPVGQNWVPRLDNFGNTFCSLRALPTAANFSAIYLPVFPCASIYVLMHYTGVFD
jgi:hypothetical protein